MRRNFGVRNHVFRNARSRRDASSCLPFTRQDLRRRGLRHRGFRCLRLLVRASHCIYIYIYIYIYINHICVYIYIYTHTYRGRGQGVCVCAELGLLDGERQPVSMSEPIPAGDNLITTKVWPLALEGTALLFAPDLRSKKGKIQGFYPSQLLYFCRGEFPHAQESPRVYRSGDPPCASPRRTRRGLRTTSAGPKEGAAEAPGQHILIVVALLLLLLSFLLVVVVGTQNA